MSEGLQTDLIAAVATPPGQGGIGVIRLSGVGAAAAAEQICGKKLKPRFATYCDFSDAGEVLDQGLALLFTGSASFTGEEVVELQGHGGPVVLQRLLNTVCSLGARLAEPGEFSERAFLNGKIDLAQAEAIADLIASTSVAAARAAINSLQGVFSDQINEITEQLAKLRILVEACIDFPDEDVEFLEDGQVAKRIEQLLARLTDLRRDSAQGRLLNEGISVALIGAPNAGKSSLLNILAGEEAAIVTDIPGTTRDLLKVDLVLEGLPIRLVDTAGLRQSRDEIEQIGIARAKAQAKNADLLLLVLDSTLTAPEEIEAIKRDLLADIDSSGAVLIIMNKVDLLAVEQTTPGVHWVSAKTGQGLAQLRSGIAQIMGFTDREAGFVARKRHLVALDDAQTALDSAATMLASGEPTEIIAEELRASHNALGEIVGTVTPDDLLGRIFSEFCIGK